MDWRVVLSNQTLFNLTSEESLVALSINTGERLWEHKSQFEHNQRIAIKGSTAYLTNDTGAMESISLDDGSTNWSTEDTITDADWQSWFPTAPVLYEDIIISATNSDDGLITARNKSSGETRWEFAMRETPSKLLISDGKLFAGTLQGDVYAIDPNSGESIWRHRITEYGDQEDPSEITRPTEPIIGIEPTESEVVITGQGFYSSVVDINSGTDTFDISAMEIGEPTTAFTHPSIVTNNGVVLAYSGSIIQSYHSESSENIKKEMGWQFEASDSLKANPAISEDGQYLITTDTRNRVCILLLETGEPSFTAETEPTAEKFIPTNKLVLVDTKESVYAFGLNH